jgi:hypothetical protein
MGVPEWCGPPVIAGAWTELEGVEALTMAHEIGAAPDSMSDLVRDFQVERLRVLPLPCYPGALLVEMQARMEDRVGLSNHLYGSWGMVTLDGGSAVIHDINEIEDALTLDTEEAARAYHALFCNTVRGEDGRFQTIVDPNDLVWRAPPDDAIFATITIGQKFRRNGSGWEIESPIAYGDTMFVAHFQLTAGGMVEMVDDDPVAHEMPIAPERWDRQFRIPPRGAAA